MTEVSIDIYSDNLLAGLRKVRPDWEFIELAPQSFDRGSSSLSLRLQKYYERFWRYPKAVKRQVADIFHIHEPSEAHLVYWLRKLGLPTVVTCHDLINFFYPNNLQGAVQLPIISRRAWLYAIRGMKYADRIIAVSSATARDTTQILNIEPERISVIPNAVEPIFGPLPKERAESFRQQQGATPETFCLLNVGANSPRKNISTILEAAAILWQSGIPIQMWKVGADFSPEQKAFIRARGIESCIRYLGVPDKATLVQIYNAADALMAPSLFEGFGLTLLEAMACATPVITSNVSAMPEVVGDAGLLVNPRDSHQIAEAAIHLYKNPVARQELVEKGLVRVRAFTWENTAEQVAQVYEKLHFNKLLHQ
ncbi:glycosyltransferase family 4 protein [Hydrococcus rivularis]|nr:glycosyltransferase family 1 protein [Hydrococcus rivularis]